MRNEKRIKDRRVRFETSEDFTRIVTYYEDHKDIRLYGYGWEIWKDGYYYRMRWYDDYRPIEIGDVRKMKTAESAKQYCRLHPVPGCRLLVRPSEPIERALRG